MPYPGFEQKYSAASYCHLQLPLIFTFCDVYHQCQAMSELCLDPCGMESSLMPFPGCWIYAAYFLKDKFKALNTLLNSAEYTITRKSVFLFPCPQTLLEHSNRWTLCDHQKPTQLRCGVRSSWEGWARIFKRLWSPGIDSKEWIPPAYVAWRAGMITLFLLGS